MAWSPGLEPLEAFGVQPQREALSGETEGAKNVLLQGRALFDM